MATPSETQYQAFFQRSHAQNVLREHPMEVFRLFRITLFIKKSGAEEARTPNLGIANAALSQLSYRPKRRNSFPLLVSSGP